MNAHPGARIVCVHGAFHELWGPHQISGRWVPAIRDGLALAYEADVAPEEIGFAFYGDLFRAEPGHPLDDARLTEIAERTGILDAAGEFLDSSGAAPSLESLMKQLGAEQVRRTIAQLGLYFDDETVRARVQARLSSMIGPATEVVLAHSMGSVVAYEYLAGLGAERDIDLITLGSPLGRHEVIGADIRPRLLDGVGEWPAGARSWTNVTAATDMVTAGAPVARLFAGVREVETDNGHRGHSPEPYLCSRPLGAALGAALRARS